MDTKNIPKHLSEALSQVLDQIEKSKKNTKTIIIDFEKTEKNQNDYLKKLMIEKIEGIETMILTNYMVNEIQDDLEPLWARIIRLKLVMSTPLRLQEAEYKQFFGSLYSLEKIKLRNIFSIRRNTNICEALPNDKIQDIDYKTGEDLNWSFVINLKKKLRILKCELQPMPNIKHPIGEIENLDVEINARNLFVYVISQLNRVSKFVHGGYLKKLTVRTTDLCVAREMLHKIPKDTKLELMEIIVLKESERTDKRQIEKINEGLSMFTNILSKKVSTQKPDS